MRSLVTMQLNSIIIPIFLGLITHNHVSAATPPNVNVRQPLDFHEPIFNSPLPRQESVPTTTIITTPSPPTTELITTMTTSTSTSTTIPPPSTTTTTKPHNHNIAVAPPSNNTSNITTPSFRPSTLKNVLPGDTLTFYFYPHNYSILQSSYALPCQPLSLSGTPSLFSGWHPTGSESGIARSKFVVTVGSSEAIWIYGVDGSTLGDIASGTGDGTRKTACELGLVMVVNPLPKDVSGGMTLGRYRDAAAGLRAGSGSSAMKEREGETVRNITYVPLGISGGEVMGVSDREKTRWEGRHPGFAGTETGNGTVGDDGGDGEGEESGDERNRDDGVVGYRNGGEKGKKMGWNWNGGNGWIGVLGVLGVGVVGLVV